ncbi:MAG: PqqD family peptide modification chaperone [Thermodesulfovibrionales bacterium]|jgi:hypothetical protein|nr:PqqD family peptide modification chaperone [Thermodesulfovibrionales bacterium]
MHFKINNPQVIHETIDGEVVIVNLDTGNYYSLDKTGAHIWNLIEKNLSLRHITEFLARRFEGKQEDIEKALHRLAEELMREGLITEDTASGIGTGDPLSIVEEQAGGDNRQTFEAPFLHKYNDMQELLLLDPIHEVDETGWPHVKRDNPSQ